MISCGPTDGDSNRARKSTSRRMENLEVSERKVRARQSISFGPADMTGVVEPHNDALVTRATIVNYEVARVFIDSDSSFNVLFKEVMDQMALCEYKFEPIATSLFGFTGLAVEPLGMINLSLSSGENHTWKTRIIGFEIIQAPSAYNVILGRPVMAAFMVVASTLHKRIKFPVGDAVGEVQCDQKLARKCYAE